MKKSIIIIFLLLVACGRGSGGHQQGECDKCPEGTTCTIEKDRYGNTTGVSCEEKEA